MQLLHECWLILMSHTSTIKKFIMKYAERVKIVILIENQIKNRCSWKLRSINTSFRRLCDLLKRCLVIFFMKFNRFSQKSSRMAILEPKRSGNVWILTYEIHLKILFSFNTHHFWYKTDKEVLNRSYLLTRSDPNWTVSFQMKKWL